MNSTYKKVAIGLFGAAATLGVVDVVLSLPHTLYVVATFAILGVITLLLGAFIKQSDPS